MNGVYQADRDRVYIEPVAKDQQIFVLGDVHGDLGALLVCLRDCAQVVDADLNWKVGVKSWVVLCGDMVDGHRPGVRKTPECQLEHEEILIQLYLNKLAQQATLYGGRVIKMIGNHELMNVNGDYRYASRAGKRSRKEFPLRRGSEFARLIYTANAYMMLQVGKWLFMHAGIGGISRKNVHLLSNINRAGREWFCTQDRPRHEKATKFLMSDNGIGRTSTVYNKRAHDKLALIREVTGVLPTRMAIGHTTQVYNEGPALVFASGTPLSGGGRGAVQWESPIPYDRNRLCPLYKQQGPYLLEPRQPRVDVLSGAMVQRKGPKGISRMQADGVARDVAMSRSARTSTSTAPRRCWRCRRTARLSACGDSEPRRGLSKTGAWPACRRGSRCRRSTATCSGRPPA